MGRSSRFFPLLSLSTDSGLVQILVSALSADSDCRPGAYCADDSHRSTQNRASDDEPIHHLKKAILTYISNCKSMVFGLGDKLFEAGKEAGQLFCLIDHHRSSLFIQVSALTSTIIIAKGDLWRW